MKVAFLDRDGTLIWEPPETKQVDSMEKFRLLPGVLDGLKALDEEGFVLVMVTNQDGLGTPTLPRQAFEPPQAELLRLLNDQGINFTEVFVCPHLPGDNCTCRKPKTGLVDAFLAHKDIDRAASLVVGDRDTDCEFAANVGVPFVKAQTNVRFPRFASLKRATKETNIEAFVNLDGSGQSRIRTGIGFFDHMLELLARHALIDLTLSATGDLQVDEHHAVEDAGLVLGAAIAKSLGDKRGIERYGFWAPMDESLAHVVLDLSGRAAFVFEGKFNREYVGEFPTELVPHFFASFAQSLKCALHMTLVRGENEHHKIESLFKGFGRCLRQALRHCPHELEVPSSKGVL